MPLLRPISVRWRRCYFAAFSACAYFSVKTRKSLLRCQQHQTSHEKQGKGDAVLSSRRSVQHYTEGCSGSLFFVIMRIREMRVACSKQCCMMLGVRVHSSSCSMVEIGLNFKQQRRSSYATAAVASRPFVCLKCKGGWLGEDYFSRELQQYCV